jgi:arylsulfatase A-like enzyme
MYFYGYKELGANAERIELYNVKDDPQELSNLYEVKKEIGQALLNELKAKLKEMNAPYLSTS